MNKLVVAAAAAALAPVFGPLSSDCPAQWAAASPATEYHWQVEECLI